MEFYFVGIGSIIIGFFLSILREAIKDYLKYRSNKETITFESFLKDEGNGLSERRLDKQIRKLKQDFISRGYEIAGHKEIDGLFKKKKIIIKFIKN